MKRYSPSTHGFYPLDIHYPNLPGDLIEISDEAHAALMDAQSQGLTIIHSDDGKLPTAAFVASFTVEQQWENLRAFRDQLLAATDFGLDTPKAIIDKFRDYRQALRDLPANTTDPAKVVWPKKPV